LLLVTGATAGVVVAVVRMEEIVVSAVTEEIVVSVRKETDRVAGTGVLVRKARTGRRVHRETDRREIVRRVRRESAWTVGRVRKETDRREIVRRVRRVRRVHRVRIGHRVHRASVSLVLSRHQQQHRLQRIQPLPPSLHQRLTPLRASSRGRVKPCYWHRHVQSIAASIAVA